MSGAWYADNQKMNFDDDMADFDGCAQFMSVRSGEFTYFLFDLKEDPTETTNLYDTRLVMTHILYNTCPIFNIVPSILSSNTYAC